LDIKKVDPAHKRKNYPEVPALAIKEYVYSRYLAEYDKFPLGQLFNRELQIRLGQYPVKKYNEQLLHLIESGRIDPKPLISHTMKLDEAPKAYMFDKKGDVIKIVFETGS
jgi:threonine dehydrogenase-like Zn-dependent dehydrogenase